jgi:hypothetical protein
MAESSTTPPEKNAPAKDEVGLLEVLQLLIETEKVRTTSDLLKYAVQYGAPEAEERLRVLEAENIPVDLAFSAISVHLRLLEYKRNSALLGSCRGQKVGLILPLPPHLPELFLPVADITFLQPGEITLHGSLHEYGERAVKGTRACRAKAQEMQALVFEAFRDGASLYVDVSIAEVIDPTMLSPKIRLIPHLRPHQNPKDVEIKPAAEVSFI